MPKNEQTCPKCSSSEITPVLGFRQDEKGNRWKAYYCRNCFHNSEFLIPKRKKHPGRKAWRKMKELQRKENLQFQFPTPETYKQLNSGS